MLQGDFRAGQRVHWRSRTTTEIHHGQVLYATAPAIHVRDKSGKTLAFTIRNNGTYVLHGVREPIDERGRCALKITT